MPTLLAVLAHPDDESFGSGGTLAKYAREGVDVHVCIVTDGAAGAYDPKLLEASGHDTLADLRRQELACACRQLEASLHLLGYADSGMTGDPANGHASSLFQADLNTVAADVLALIREIAPDVVLTHDPTGGYFHPDHIKVNQAVLRAYELGEFKAAPPLYYSVIPRSAVIWFVRFMRLTGKDPRRVGVNGDIDLTRVGVPNGEIDVRLNVGPYLPIKERASACHASQGGGGMARLIPRFLARRLMRYEHFVLARPLGAGPHEGLF